MAMKIIPFNITAHREAFFEMNIEFVEWSHEQILAHHGVDMDSGTGSAREYVESMFDDLVTLVPPAGFIYVLEVNDELAGMALIKAIGEGIGEVKRMYIRPEHRGKGYGHEMMRMLMTAAEEIGYSKLRLETADFMPAALRVYRSAGFRERGEYPGGEVPEWYRPYCIFMEKDLTSEQA
ncbi:MAG: GNAT family N-acetyltransferase [Candidatus Thorarchaeota archaeon]|jgi:ribosomal protein S18 acetylase RimI-like enzyme